MIVTPITPHLNKKKLSTNSLWDFEYVLETMDDYWVGQYENSCPKSTAAMWCCNHFSIKRSKSKSDTSLYQINMPKHVFWSSLCLLCGLSSSAAKSDYITCPKNHHKVFYTDATLPPLCPAIHTK